MGRHWVVYALGGGAGHALRGAQLCAGLADLGIESTLLCAAQAADWARDIAPRVVGLGRELLADSVAAERRGSVAALAPRDMAAERLALRQQIEQVLDETQADVLLLDTFPGGILGELRPLPRVARSVFMTRFRRVDAEFQALCAAFDLVVDLEPNLGWFSGRAVAFGPVARRLVAEPATSDVTLVASEPDQCAALARFQRRFADLRTAWVTPEAGLRSGYATRVVIGPCGYNLCYELAQVGIWHVGLPAKRRYDDQRLRAEHLGLSVYSPEALERRVRALLQSGVRPSEEYPSHGELAQLLVSRVG